MGLFGNRGGQGETPQTDRDAKQAPLRKGGQPEASGAHDATRTNRSKGFGNSDTKTDGPGPSSRENAVATIGKSIVFKGELTGSEDLEVNGTVEGDVKLPDNTLTIGQTGHVKASVSAKSVQIVGKVKGDVTATERIEIEASGVVDGDLRAPRLLVQEGAVMNGSVEMTSGASADTSKTSTPASPSTASSTASPTASANRAAGSGSTPTAN